MILKKKIASLFTGIGGFDLGFEAAGFEISLQVENDKYCRALLMSKWPNIRKLSNVKSVDYTDAELICGGDPCQARSTAKIGRKASAPDLSGYFLALVGRSAPRWVVRENVPASDVGAFAAGLGLLGYGVIIIELDARDFTAQSRRRQFVIGCPPGTRDRIRKILFKSSVGLGRNPQKIGEGPAAVGCITAHPHRFSDSDTPVFENGKGLRFLTAGGAEALQGFPRGWTAGFSRTRRFKMIGNAVPPPMVKFIAEAIAKADCAEEQDHD